MKSLPLIFLGVFFTLAFSWTGIVLTTHRQLVDSNSMYPTTAVVLDAAGNELSGPTFKDPLTERNLPGLNQEREDLFPRALSGCGTAGTAGLRSSWAVSTAIRSRCAGLVLAPTSSAAGAIVNLWRVTTFSMTA
jgi:hypothetical protein